MIDEKIKQLRAITSNFIFIEYYSHTKCDMWKILNEYTHFAQCKIVLCSLDDGIENAIDMAIEHISKRKIEFNS